MIIQSVSNLLAIVFGIVIADGAENVKDAGENATTRGIIDFARPKNAVQLIGPSGSQFVAENPELVCKWTFQDGILTASPKWDSVVTPEAYQDFRMHLEFNVNNSTDLPPEMNGNSGIYIQQRYELQILNSFGVSPSDYKATDCGSIYQQKKPDQIVCRPAGEWQSFDIAFRAARFQGGQKIQNARITVYHNEHLIHDDYPLKRQSGAGKKEQPIALPIKLQGHHNQVRFRNVWIQRLSLENHPVPESESWLTYKGSDGPGKGKHVVLIAAEQEYRSEQAMPMLAKVLSEHHGFDCTVLFSVNANGEVDPTLPAPFKDKKDRHNIPGLQYLSDADCMIWISRFMQLPDEQMTCFHDYFDSGKPLIALRTANHGFMGGKPYRVNERIVSLRELLGGTFIEHHGGWHRESTKGIVVPENRSHPILIGVNSIWGTSDVYRCHNDKSPFPDDCTTLVLGQPLVNLKPDAPANESKVPLPVAWTKTWIGNKQLPSKIFHCTMGSAEDFANAGVRRMTINAVYWGLGIESEITPDRSVDIVGEYQPLAAGFNYEALGVKPHKPSFYK
ncbi:MAG: family 16 glycoside hydrolase [Pirellula sp.]